MYVGVKGLTPVGEGHDDVSLPSPQTPALLTGNPDRHIPWLTNQFSTPNLAHSLYTVLGS